MTRRLPPLNALRAFEAAARLESMSRAADELSVTHAAVSHQVKALEEWVGKTLFRREHRRIRLTEAGADLLPVLVQAFDAIDARIADVMAAGDRRILTITAAPSVAYRWIVPRLPRFSLRHPEIDVRLEHSMALVDLKRDRAIDVGIRYGSGGWDGLTEHRLMSGSARPLAAPALLARHGLSVDDLPLTVETIASLPLHHEETRQWWRRWFEENGLKHADVSGGAVFYEAGAILDLAIAGHGAVLGRFALAAEALRAGLLVQLHDAGVQEETCYWLVYDETRADDPAIAAFRMFILEELAALDDGSAEAESAQ
jgi:LysR family transcriptional regulator, glycine cleavage system transcriptional activator